MANNDAAIATNRYLDLAEAHIAVANGHSGLMATTAVATAQVYATMAVAAATRDYEGG